MTPAIISFGAASAELAARIAGLIGGAVYHCGFNGEDAKKLLPRLFNEGRPIIGICAAGILIRLLAPYIADKTAEPPVLALSQDGTQIVPLLGGHHGANRLARELADKLGGTASLTTASDAKFLRGLDEPPPGWVLADAAAAKPAMMALLVGAKLLVEGHAPWLGEAGYPLSFTGGIKVLVTERETALERGLVYHPATLVAGVGAERGADATEVIDLITRALAAERLSPRSLAALATLELKADETAFHKAAAHFGVPLRVFSVAELSQERHRLVNPSAVVEAETGTPGVAEAAAFKAGMLVVPKLKSARATCAIGRAPQPIDSQRFGRAPGQLHVIGIGPGAPGQRTAAAVDALAASSDWVGYGLYLDLVADLNFGQSEHRFGLGDEEVRVRHALELAASGKTVALICSGDAQIYAMAALVYELVVVRGPREVSDAARRIGITVHPGISAVQSASATAGALIGHDFCCISLSDLLTPRDDIIKRLKGAAEADFVTALYNPRSQRRTDLIEEAKAMFLAARPADTPVVIGSNVGRVDEQMRVTTLAEFDPTSIDMLTIVIIGSSASQTFLRGNGKTVAFTPRGYAKKAERE